MLNPESIEFKVLGSHEFPKKDGEFKEYIEDGYCQTCMVQAWMVDGRKGWSTSNHAYLMFLFHNFLTIYETDEIYYCDPDTSIWKDNTLQFIKKVSPFGTFSTRGYNETIAKLQSITYADENHSFDYRKDIVPLADGWWDIPNETFHSEYTPEMYVTKTLNLQYGDPEADPKTYDPSRILKFLGLSLTKQGVQDFTDMLASMLYPESQKILFIIIGDTDMGKGQMMILIDRLFGKENTWKLRFSQINSNNFHKDYFIFELENKYAVFIDESEYGLEQLDILKELSGGADDIPARTPTGKPQRIPFYGQFLLFGNHLPAINFDRAFFNRLKFIKVNPNPIPEDDLVENIAKMFTEDELIGYLRMILERMNKFDFRTKSKDDRILENVANWLDHGDIVGDYPITRMRQSQITEITEQSTGSNGSNGTKQHESFTQVRDAVVSLLKKSNGDGSSGVHRTELRGYLEGANFSVSTIERSIDLMLRDGELTRVVKQQEDGGSITVLQLSM